MARIRAVTVTTPAMLSDLIESLTPMYRKRPLDPTFISVW